MNMMLKKCAPFALAASLAFASMSTAYANDLSGHWARKAMDELQQQNFITGYEDNSLRPDAPITRAEFITVINKMMGFTTSKEISFSDVKEGDWYKNAIAIAVANGYCKGYEDNTFKPNAQITRAEASVMLARALSIKEDTSAELKFSDNMEIPAWAKSEIAKLFTAKYISGYPDGSFKPANSISRAEAFTLLHRSVLNKEVMGDVTVNADSETVKNQRIKGNLIISKSVGEGSVRIENTKIYSNLIIRGGGKNSVYLKNVEILGKVIIEKEGVKLQLQENTKASDIEATTSFLLSENGFDGNIKSLTISNQFKSKHPVEIQVPISNLKLNATSTVNIAAKVENIDITREARNSIINLKNDVEVSTLNVSARADILGKGKAKLINVNVEGVKIDSAIKNKSKVVLHYQRSSSSTSSSSSSSTSTPASVEIKVKSLAILGDAKLTQDNEIKELTLKYEPENATNKAIDWSIVGGQKNVKIISSTSQSVKLQALDNGNYTLKAAVRNSASVSATISGEISNQVVSLASGSMGTAEDKAISGLNADELYILKMDGKYLAINEAGNIIGEYEKKEDAISFSKALAAVSQNKAKINGLNNAQTYEVIMVKAEESFQIKIQSYLKYTEADITTKNAALIEELAVSLLDEAEELIGVAESSEQQKALEKAKEKIEQKQAELQEKIDRTKAEIQQILAALKHSINDQIMENLDYDRATTVLSYVKSEMSKLAPEAVDQLDPSEKDKLSKLEADLTLAEKIKTLKLVLGEDGSTENPLKEYNLTVQLMKEDANTPRKIEEYNVAQNTEIPNVIQRVRKEGLGRYFVSATLKDTFQYLNLPFQSNVQEVKAIVNDLGTLYLAGNNFGPVPNKPTNTKIRFNLNDQILEWDAIANAKTYDIFAELTLFSREVSLGGAYLEPSVQGTPEDLTNIENEFKYSELPSVDNKMFIPTQYQTSKRIFVAVGLTDTKVSLSKFVPAQGGQFDIRDSSTAPQDADLGTLKISIVPRNENSLYISNAYRNNDPYVINYDSVFAADFTWGDFKKFLPGWR